MPPVVMQDMLLVNIKAMITLGNLILLLCLLFIYARSYNQIKSKFAMGLIAFIVLLIMQTVTAYRTVKTTIMCHRVMVAASNAVIDVGAIVER